MDDPKTLLSLPRALLASLFLLLLWPATATAALECFQVAQPVLTPAGPTTSRDDAPPIHNGSACTVTLMDHVFGNSYGVPFVGQYTPPTGCASSFNRVVLNFTAVSEGRQFDRLALMFLGDTEIWRTSTAEPVAPPGIRWVYLLDATPYLALWRQPQTLAFHLGNLINDKYTGSFNTTLTATFFYAKEADEEHALPSDQIIALSSKQADGVPTHFTLPSDNVSVTVTDFPRNARRAVFSVSANGQADEEFWWSNVLSSDADAFQPTLGSALPGFSPFREVQVYVDGLLAGVQWPFPVVFTGGVVPSLHRPIVGQDVFQLREHEIDLTPWLPLLGDGQAHTFSIRVVGIDDSRTNETGAAVLSQMVGSSWYVTGKVFVWLDEAGDGSDKSDNSTENGARAELVRRTPGTVPVYQVNALSIDVSHDRQTNATGTLETLTSRVSVARTLHVVGRTGEWTQVLEYTNDGVVGAFGYDQVNTFALTGRDRAGRWGEKTDDVVVYATEYSYPLFCNQTMSILPEGNLTLWAVLDQGLDLTVSGAAVFPTGLEAFAGTTSRSSVLHSHFNGTASFAQTGDGKSSSGFGGSSQTFSFGSDSTTLYTRAVTGVNNTVLSDEETIAGRGTTSAARGTAPVAAAASAGQLPRFARIFLLQDVVHDLYDLANLDDLDDLVHDLDPLSGH